MSKSYVVRAVKVLIDTVVLCAAYGLAFLLRFEGWLAKDVWDGMVSFLPCVLLVKLVCMAAFNVPRLSWRFASLVEARRLGLALAMGSGLLGMCRLSADYLGFSVPAGQDGRIPLSVLLIDFMLSFVGAMVVRLTVRLWWERFDRCRAAIPGHSRVPTLFIGAGCAGALVSKEIKASPGLGVQPIGFLDDDPNKLGMQIHGIPVLGTTANIDQVVQETGAKQALITFEDAPGPNIRRIASLCDQAGIPTKIIPGIREMVEGRCNLSAIRDVAIEDLLRREPVRLDNQAIARIIAGRTVLVSGAGGSIGSELCRELCRFGPATLLLLEQAENCLFHVHRRLAAQASQVQLVPCIGDICDQARMEQLFSSWRPDVVFHAAAHKHVPLMEWNPGEAIKNNIVGTRNLADLADAFGAGEFVMISTDKAVNPTSVMGVSKRIAEMYIQSLSQRSDTRFVTVRFGNVLGSAGSVIPIFKEQIAKGGPITVTHPEMKRYFMTIPEACQLVLQAASMGRGGEIFILDMGKPVKIVDLARDLIRLSGLLPHDIEIRFTGLRPGEKLFEELLLEEENAQRTQHPKIFIGRLNAHDWKQMARLVEELRELAMTADPRTILLKLKETVPEYDPSNSYYGDQKNGFVPSQGGEMAIADRNGHGPKQAFALQAAAG